MKYSHRIGIAVGLALISTAAPSFAKPLESPPKEERRRDAMKDKDAEVAGLEVPPRNEYKDGDRNDAFKDAIQQAFYSPEKMGRLEDPEVAEYKSLELKTRRSTLLACMDAFLAYQSNGKAPAPSLRCNSILQYEATADKPTLWQEAGPPPCAKIDTEYDPSRPCRPVNGGGSGTKGT